MTRVSAFDGFRLGGGITNLARCALLLQAQRTHRSPYALDSSGRGNTGPTRTALAAGARASRTAISPTLQRQGPAALQAGTRECSYSCALQRMDIAAWIKTTDTNGGVVYSEQATTASPPTTCDRILADGRVSLARHRLLRHQLGRTSLSSVNDGQWHWIVVVRGNPTAQRPHFRGWRARGLALPGKRLEWPDRATGGWNRTSPTTTAPISMASSTRWFGEREMSPAELYDLYVNYGVNIG